MTNLILDNEKLIDVNENIKLIPNYAYANRGETDMLVWMTKK